MTTPPPVPKPLDQMTDAERQARLVELQAQARGWEALQGAIPEEPDPFSAAKIGVPTPSTFREDALSRQRLEELQAQNEQEQTTVRAAINARVKAAREASGAERFGLPPRPAAAPSPTAAPAAPPSAQVPPAAAEAPQEMRTIVVSRKDPNGKLVAETIRVPANDPRQGYTGGIGGGGGYVTTGQATSTVPFSEQIRNLAGTMPKIDLAAPGGAGFGLGAPGQGGPMSGTRQLSGLEQSVERNRYLQQRADAELGREQQMAAREQALASGGAGIEETLAKAAESRARGQLAGAQAGREQALGGIAEEQRRDIEDPTRAIQRQLAEYDFIKQRIAPDILRAVEDEVNTRVATLTRAGLPPDPATLDALRRKALETHSGKAYADLIRELQLATPGGYAATLRAQGTQ